MLRTPPESVASSPSLDSKGQAVSEVDVSVLIVGYRSKDLLRGCLKGLFEHTADVAMEVLYVDCSGDGSVEMVRDAFPEVRVIDNQDNLGFARGNNLLARHAHGRFLLLLNPNTLIHDNAVGELVAFARSSPDGGAWGGVTMLADGRIDRGSQQSGPNLRYALFRLLGIKTPTRGTLPDDATEPVDVDVLCGASADDI
jgi:N-acetylglucosaminyl-diphospho-decaprenol L-rhamnosyltransferase